MSVLDALISALNDACRYNHNDQVAPAAVLWPDGERLWERVVPRLRPLVPLLTLGPYQPEALTGPAIWLRCILAGTLETPRLPQGTPVLYLPGVSRQSLRAVKRCPPPLQPLVELQYRGVFFSQKNARDWTPHAFLQGYLGVKVREDEATQKALVRALECVMDEAVTDVRGRAPLDAGFFDRLLNPDPDQRLLAWLDDPEAETARMQAGGAQAWAAFRELCKKTYRFDPVTDGPVTAAERLGGAQGAWQSVWARFREAPSRYPHLPELLRRAGQGNTDMFRKRETYPQDNEDEEARLRQALLALAGQGAAEARTAIKRLEEEHGARRTWVWFELSQAPLAGVLEPLVHLAQLSESPLGNGTPKELAERYAAECWQLDRAAMTALASVTAKADVEAVQAALGAIYRPWVETSANSFQEAVAAHGLEPPSAEPIPEAGCCLFFSDGLRYDVAMTLAELLEQRGHRLTRDWRFGALPGVTATAKAAISPVAERFEAGSEFSVRVNGATVNASVLRRELGNVGLEVLQGSDTGDPDTAAWTEYGNLDSVGHHEGWKLAQRLDKELAHLLDRIEELLAAGWREIKLITDHGWLLLPGGFPSADLPQHLSEARKGHCARLKDGSSVSYTCLPWHFDPQVQIALAPGITTFVAGKEYEHGGVSVQECVLPVLQVRPAKAAGQVAVTLQEVSWRGLRCRVQLEGAPPNATVDLRTKAADGSSSVATGQEPKPLDADGKASLLVADDTLEGVAVHVVVLSPEGEVLVQQVTTVGGE